MNEKNEWKNECKWNEWKEWIWIKRRNMNEKNRYEWIDEYEWENEYEWV